MYLKVFQKQLKFCVDSNEQFENIYH